MFRESQYRATPMSTLENHRNNPIKKRSGKSVTAYSFPPSQETFMKGGREVGI